MRQRLTIERALPLVIALSVAAVALATRAQAHPANPEDGPNVPCAVLQDYGGALEILDASRMSLITVQRGAAIPCGGWVSVTQGWAKLKHRDGHKLRVGPGSFAEFLENNRDGEDMGDHVVLFRGAIWADADPGSGELRIITANGRARLSDAAAIVIYNQGTEETQLIALENKAKLENRFESSRVATVQAGEASSLNFGLLRVVPSQPRAVSVASLREIFAQLHVGDGALERAIAAARQREERKFASRLTTDPDEPERKPAGEAAPRDRKSRKNTYTAVTDEGPAPQAHSYFRHPISAKERARIRRQWVNRMTAGEPVGERILFPDRFYGRPQKVKVQVIDASPHAKKHGARASSPVGNSEEMEKQRLIDELSKIRED